MRSDVIFISQTPFSRLVVCAIEYGLLRLATHQELLALNLIVPIT